MRTRRLALSLTALVSAGLLVCVLLAEEPEEGRRYALVVGVQDYKDTALGSLHYCDNDAAGLADVLRQRGYRVILMTRPEWRAKDRDDLLPTADNIRDNLKAILRNRKPADTVLLAFSGHGEQLKKDGKMYFCAAKCNLDKPETLVALDEVYALLKDNPAGGKVLIVDACRNDPLAGKTVGSEKLESVTRPELPDPPGGTVALFSCSRGEMAYESDALKHGYLFHFVIEGLEGKAAGKGGRIKWTDLTKHVDDELSDAVLHELGSKAVQTPEVRGESHGLVLARIEPGSAPSATTPLAQPDNTYPAAAVGAPRKEPIRLGIWFTNTANDEQVNKFNDLIKDLEKKGNFEPGQCVKILCVASPDDGTAMLAKKAFAVRDDMNFIDKRPSPCPKFLEPVFAEVDADMVPDACVITGKPIAAAKEAMHMAQAKNMSVLILPSSDADKKAWEPLLPADADRASFVIAANPYGVDDLESFRKAVWDLSKNRRRPK